MSWINKILSVFKPASEDAGSDISDDPVLNELESYCAIVIPARGYPAILWSGVSYDGAVSAASEYVERTGDNSPIGIFRQVSE